MLLHKQKSLLILLWMAATLFFWGIVYSSDPIWKKMGHGIFFLIINVGLLLTDHLNRHKMKDLKSN